MLALARASWVNQMERRLAERGYPGYRRTDAVVVRMLMRHPFAVGRLGASLGVTRQAARKVVDGLQQRGYAHTERGAEDARQVNVVLTGPGAAYGQAISEVIEALNSQLVAGVEAGQLWGADAVLRAAIAPGTIWAATASRLPPPRRQKV